MNLPALIFATFTLLVFPIITVSAQPQSEQSAKTELKALDNMISELQDSLKKLNRKRTSTEQKLSQTEQAIHTLQRDIYAIEKQIKNSHHTIAKLERRQQVLTKKKQRQKILIATSLRSIYQTSGDNRLKLILNQEDPELLSRQLVYFDYLQQAQLKNLKAFQSTIAELKANVAEKHSINEILQSKHRDLKQKQEALNKQRAERKKLIAVLQLQYRKNSTKLGDIENQRTELEGILAQLKSKNSLSNTPINKMRGNLPWPIKGKLLSRFNENIANTKIRWQGIRIAARKGQKVKAVYDGRVVFANRLRGYGQLIILDHGKGYLTLYAHNQLLLKQVGGMALAGEPIALAGTSGGQTAPGLYFEIRYKGKAQDPLKWLHH
ncbi:MAG: peptidoglycan DD-metalloendopeptidase family protein [Endozoicomonas sp. (ex Botrylloides leachii)]|nr:peptidoglycan DD-metalloendopeptidase family protein [Endozoicomonas sp. (ex Botrylloides leachii)]